MKQALLAMSLLAAAAVPAFAQQDIDARIEAVARPWLQAENPSGNAAKIDETVACVMAVLTPLPADLKATMSALNDFEDVLDLAVKFDDGLERPLEMCF